MKLFHYYIEGTRVLYQDPFLLSVQLLLLFIGLIWLFRRLIILRTGGNFLAPYHIVGDVLYIHSGFLCIGKRAIPFSEMRAVHIDSIHNRHGERYYFIQILRKSGLNKCFIISNNPKGQIYLSELKEAFRKHGVGVRNL